MKELSAKDRFNARNNGHSFDAILEKEVTFEGVMFYDDDVTNKETGEIERKTISAVKINGEMYCSPSDTLRRALTDLVEYANEEKVDTVQIMIVNGSSSKGRKFLTLNLM